MYKIFVSPRLLVFVLTGTVFLSASCVRKPMASFDTDKGTYTAGEEVLLTNRSANASSQEWFFQDSLIGTSVDMKFTLSRRAFTWAAVPGSAFLVKPTIRS